MAESFTDITKTDFKKYYGKIDILTGGFPCQPYSSAGKRKGKEDERHLWPEMLRAIREVSPRFVVGENVRGLTNWNGGLVFEEVCAELESYGYQVAPVIIPACGVGAPHRRERVWFVAYSDSNARRRRPCESGCEERETISDGQPKIYTGANANGQKGDAANAERSGGIQRSENIQSNKSNGYQFIRNGRKRNVANTDSNGLNQCNGKDEINTSQRGFNAQRNIDESDGNGDTTNAEGEGLQRRQNAKGWKKYSTKWTGTSFEFRAENENINGKFRSNFENFPTQSPICGGNDGISRELDGITFSKWRAESIKAYGNAIVPQVAYQIFKALELCK